MQETNGKRAQRGLNDRMRIATYDSPPFTIHDSDIFPRPEPLRGVERDAMVKFEYETMNAFEWI